MAPQCSSGPFAALDPLVRQYWYLNVLEGLPITAQVPLIALYSIIPTALGLLGSWLAIRRVAEPLRGDWRVLLVLQIGAAAISIWVLRALYVSHAFAVPGCAYLALATWQRARTIEKVPARVLASVAVVIAVPAVPLAIVSKLDEAAAANASNAMTPVLNPCFPQEPYRRAQPDRADRAVRADRPWPGHLDRYRAQRDSHRPSSQPGGDGQGDRCVSGG